MSNRPDICLKRGCYIKPKSLFPEWDSLNQKCDECPYHEEPYPQHTSESRAAIQRAHEFLDKDEE